MRGLIIFILDKRKQVAYTKCKSLAIMSDTKIPFVLNHWKEKLEIQHYKITCKKILPLQVCDEYFRRGHEFVVKR